MCKSFLSLEVNARYKEHVTRSIVTEEGESMAHLRRWKYFNVAGRDDKFGGVVISKVGIICEYNHVSA